MALDHCFHPNFPFRSWLCLFLCVKSGWCYDFHCFDDSKGECLGYFLVRCFGREGKKYQEQSIRFTSYFDRYDILIFGKLLILLFSFWQQKEKSNKKERLPSALFELLRHFSTLNKKNSLLKQLFVFNASKSTSALRSKSEAGHSDATLFCSLKWMLMFRHLVEEREGNWGYFREEEKAVWAQRVLFL